MNRQRLDSPLVYVGAHNVYYVKLPVKVLYFTIHIHTQINQYVVISDFPPVSVEKFNLCSVMAHHRPWLRNDNPQKNDGVFDIDNMPLTEEPECVINDLNLYSKNSKI